MATHPTPTPTPTPRSRDNDQPNKHDSNTPSPTPSPTPTYPGGMASDPAVALANDIVSSIRGEQDRFRTIIENSPELKAAWDKANVDTAAEVAMTVRRFINAEVAKATGGVALGTKAAE